MVGAEREGWGAGDPDVELCRLQFFGDDDSDSLFIFLGNVFLDAILPRED